MMDEKVFTLQGPSLLSKRTSKSLLVMMMMGLVVPSKSLLFYKKNYNKFLASLDGYFFIFCRGRRIREFKVVIKLASRADLHHLGMFLQGRQADAPQEALQVLDIVLRELPTARYGSRLAWHCECNSFHYNDHYWVVKITLKYLLSCFLKYFPYFVVDCRYSPVGRSFYSPDLGRMQPLGEGLECWRGFYQSIHPTQMGLSLNIGEHILRLY